MKAFIDFEQADLVFGRLLHAQEHKVFPYDQIVLPQDFVPEAIKKDDVTHARFLFYVCHYMRGTIKSDHAVTQLVKLWEYDPYLFHPHHARKRDTDELSRLLKRYIPYGATTVNEAWVINSARLVDHWGGDPRNIFKEVGNASDMYRLITNKKVRGKKPKNGSDKEWGFIFFQEKMASMLAYFLMEAGLIESSTITPPVDFHLLRLMIATEVIKITEESACETLRYEHMSPLGIEVIQKYCDDNDINMVTMGNALWPLSVGLCSQAPGNSMVNAQKEKKKAESLVINWNNPNHYESFMRSCGSCPLESVCKFNVPSGLYYYTGQLKAIPRLNPYGTVLSLFDDLVPQRRTMTS